MNMRVERKKYLVDNFIKVYDNAVSPEVCKYFIDFFEKEDKLGHTEKGRTGNKTNKKVIQCTGINIKFNGVKNEIYDLPEHLQMLSSCQDSIYKLFNNYIKSYDIVETLYTKLIKNNKSVFKEEKLWYGEMSTGPIMYRYEPPDDGYHAWHQDWGSHPLSNGRMLVGTLYLNDVEEGGETEFLYQNIKIKPEQGKLVIFPAYFTHTHRGNKPVSNKKYIISSWGYPII